MRLDAWPFALIKSGTKTIELRLYDDKRSKIKVGDKISFTSRETGESIMVEVFKLHRADTFFELIDEVGLSKLGVTSKVDLLKELEIYYPLNMQQGVGVVGIEFKKG